MAANAQVRTVDGGGREPAGGVDGLHLALSLRDVDAQEFTLGIPVAQVVQLIEHGARTLADCAREGQDVESKLIGCKGRFSGPRLESHTHCG